MFKKIISCLNSPRLSSKQENGVLGTEGESYLGNTLSELDWINCLSLAYFCLSCDFLTEGYISHSWESQAWVHYWAPLSLLLSVSPSVCLSLYISVSLLSLSVCSSLLLFLFLFHFLHHHHSKLSWNKAVLHQNPEDLQNQWTPSMRNGCIVGLVRQGISTEQELTFTSPTLPSHVLVLGDPGKERGQW